MKKLIVLSVVFALMVGSVFAVDLGGTVFGKVDVIKGDSGANSKITSGGSFERVRIDGAGDAADGVFGGYIRYQGTDVGVDSAWAFWKPIDQFKLIIGGNSDGFWGKEGVTGWGFNQMPYDGGVAINPGTWYGDTWGSSIYGNLPYMHSRYVFFEGVVDNGALLEITPADIFGVNLFIPFIRDDGKELADVFQAMVAQVSINLDIGNIAITYDGGGRGSKRVGSKGAIYASFNGAIGDLGLDVGFSYHLEGDTSGALPIGIGVGVKYATDSFGVKFKLSAALAGDDKTTWLNAAVVPYFNLSDNMAAFVNAGLGVGIPDGGDAKIGWYFNPYLRVGAEWGPSFYAGVKLYAELGNDTVNFAIPIALMVSF